MKNLRNMLAQSTNWKESTMGHRTQNLASMLAITLIIGFAAVIIPNIALAESKADCLKRCAGTTMAGTNGRITCDTGCASLGSGGGSGPRMKDCDATGERIKARDWSANTCELVDCPATGEQIAKGQYTEDDCVLVDCPLEGNQIAQGTYTAKRCEGPNCCEVNAAKVRLMQSQIDGLKTKVANLETNVASKADANHGHDLPLWLIILLILVVPATIIAFIRSFSRGGGDDGPSDPSDPNYRVRRKDLTAADEAIKASIPDTDALARRIEDLENAAPDAVDTTAVEKNVFRSVLSALPGQFVSVNEMDERMELDGIHKALPTMETDLESAESTLDEANQMLEIANEGVTAVETEISGADAKISEAEEAFSEADDAVDELPAEADAETITKAKAIKVTAKKAVKTAKKAKSALPAKLEDAKLEAVTATETVTAAEANRDMASERLEGAHKRIAEIEDNMATRKADASDDEPAPDAEPAPAVDDTPDPLAPVTPPEPAE